MGSGFVFHSGFMKPIFNSSYYLVSSPFGGFLCKYWIDMNNFLVLIKIILSYSHYTHQQEDTLGLTIVSFYWVSLKYMKKNLELIFSWYVVRNSTVSYKKLLLSNQVVLINAKKKDLKWLNLEALFLILTDFKEDIISVLQFLWK